MTLTPETRLIRGQEHVTYTNNSLEPVEYVWVHLEQNVLRKDSIGALVGGGHEVGGDSESTNGVRLLAVSASGSPLAHQVYETMCRIVLATPVAAGGGKVEFDVAWEFVVPERVFRRYGIQKVKKGTVWELAQWFPAVAVYDDVHGWNTLPYIGSGEFYTTFGTYDVLITAPRDHLVVATGVLQNEADVYTVPACSCCASTSSAPSGSTSRSAPTSALGVQVPQPADIVRTMEAAAGADLAWIWRGWFVESTSLDQAVDSVQQPSNQQPGLVTITNLDRMVMPLTFRVTYADDTTETFDLPVQIWFTSDRVQRRVSETKPIKKVEVDPAPVWPDARRSNNVWTSD